MAIAGAAVVLAILAFVAKDWYDSRLPATYNVMDYGRHDYGGGPEPAGHAGHEHGGGISVADLHGPGVRVRRTTASSSPLAQRTSG